MRLGRLPLLVIAILLTLATDRAFGQGSATSSSISGTVVDSGGGVIPGATVTVKSTATNRTFTAVTNSGGAFVVPALKAGTYSVTVSLAGFKSAIYNDVRLTPGAPASIKATLEVGSLTETVEVKGGAEIVNTQTPTVSATLNVDQVNRLPMATRNALNAVAFLPGVNTSGVNRDSTFNGLPDSFSLITIDGVPNNDNFNKSSEGLFAMVTPRQDAVEAVTVTTAAGGADVGGSGAIQIAFVTRSGTNRFTGSGYHYHRDPDLNSNYWFNENQNLPKNDVVLNQYGFRQGGPIVVPGLYDGRGKAFFFFNYEELRLPNNFTRARTVLNPAAISGNYLYTVSGATRSINVLALAGANGIANAVDPTVNKVLTAIQTATTFPGSLLQQSDPLLMSYTWQSPGFQIEKQPITKLDYNLSPAHRFSATYNWQVVDRDPDHLNGGDIRFPTSINYSHYVSYRYLFSMALRSTLGANLVNEVRAGWRWGPGSFGQPESNGPASFADTGDSALTLGLGLTNWHTQNGPTSRDAGSFNIDDSLTWQRGRHSLSFGTSILINPFWVDNQQIVPTIGFNVDDTNDPAQGLFTAANFPGASTGQLGNAEALFALLTGRVSSIGGTAYLDETTNQYVYLGKRRQKGQINEFSFYAQDSWRLSPTVTLNGGLRWDVQMPFQPTNSIMAQSSLADACGVSGMDASGQCRFYSPGATGGKAPTFVEFPDGEKGYSTDWNNIAPNAGIAWRPAVEDGWLRHVLGDPEQATLRAGYQLAYNREGFAVFTARYGANPGSSTSVTRSAALGNLVTDGGGYPLYLSQTDRLGPAAYPSGPVYPIAVRSGRADSINIFQPDIKVASARTYTVGFQRALSRNMAVEVRYVGTRGVNLWNVENWNEINIENNGFIDEFRQAMANLQANNAAGGSRAGSFAYFGSGSGTSPLPIYLAYMNGRNDAANTAAYSGANWTNSTFVGRLAVNNPNPQSAASDLDGNAGRRTNAINAGLPANFFVLNGEVGSVNVQTSSGRSDYNALQIELRRRLTRGFQVNGSYQFATEAEGNYVSHRYGYVVDPRDNVRHAFKFQWDWSLPIGRGRRFGNDLNAVLDGVVGGWEVNGAGRIQARTVDLGNVRLVGMTLDELTKEYFFRIGDDPANAGRRLVKMLPDDIILNTRRAFSVSATSATGYSDLGLPEGRYIAPSNSAACIELKDGDCAPRTTVIRAPWFTRVDVSLAKKFLGTRRVNFELKFDVLNLFDNVNFNPVANPGSGETIFQVTSAYTDLNNTFDPGGRLGQITWRINW